MFVKYILKRGESLMNTLDKFIAYEYMNKLQALCFFSILVPLFEFGAFLVNKLGSIYMVFLPFLVLVLFAIFRYNYLEYPFFVTYISIWLFGSVIAYDNYKKEIELSVPMWLYSIFIVMAIVWVYLYNKDCLKPKNIKPNEYLVCCSIVHRINDYLFNLSSKQELYNYADDLTKNFKCSIPKNSSDKDILSNNYYMIDDDDNTDFIGGTARIIIAAINTENKDVLIKIRNIVAYKLKRKSLCKYNVE